MLFAHLKRILKLGRLRLRGPRGAQDEFTLAAIAQNLRRLAKLVVRPPPAAISCALLNRRLLQQNRHKDGVIGRPACRSLEILGAALQADGGTRSAFAASSIRRRSAAWTILLDWTYQSRKQVSASWTTRAGSCGRRRWRANQKLCCRC